MTGDDLAADGHRLALAYARLRPAGTTWLVAWLADDQAAADELMEWELEGHPSTDLPMNTGAETMTVTDALNAILALYTVPGTWTREGIAQDAAGRQVAADSPEAVAWSLEGALHRVVGDPEEAGITEDEWRRRIALEGEIFDASGVDLMAFNDAAQRQDVVAAVLRAGLARSARSDGT